MARVIFGAYTPDQPPLLNQQDQGVYGLTMADGCYKIRNGYAPVSQFSALQNGSLGSAPIGGGAYRYTGQAYIFAGNATNIYTYSSSGFTSVQSGLTTTAANGLRFCPYGKYMFVTNGQDPIKQFDPGSPTTLSTLSVSAPTARFMAVVRGVLVCGYAGGNPLRVQWSDNGNPAGWTTGGSSISGQFDMPSGGDITAVVGGEYGLVFQEQRILRMTYTGDSAVWQFDEVATDIGCVAAKSMATVGKISFFYSNRGFMAFDGATLQPIGTEKVDRTFQALLDRNYTDNMSAVIDPTRSLYIVSIPSANPPTSVLIYNYVEKEWTTAPLTTPLMFSGLSLSVSVDQLDAIYGNLDAMTISMDSAALRGGYPAMFVFSSGNVLGQLSGSPMAATFKDGLKEFIPTRKSRIGYIRPLTDATNLSVTVSGMNGISGTTTATNYSASQSNGIFRTRENWNLSQVKLTIPAGTPWTYCLGYDLSIADGGRT
jgi:hypothetical protein